MILGLMGAVLVQWIVIVQLHSRLDKHARYLRRDKVVLKALETKISDITKYGNSSLKEAFRRIDEGSQESQYLDDKIDTLLELLIQEHEESVK